MHGITCRPERLFDAVADFFIEDGGAAAARTLLVPGQEDVLAWRASFASSRPGLAFDMKITTLQGYVGEQWCLFGDGRRFITPMAARLAMAREADRLGPEGPGTDAGTIDLLCRAAEIGLGMPRFDEKLSGRAPAVGEGSSAVWRTLASYSRALEESGCATYGQALALLAAGWGDAVRAGAKPPVLAGFDYLLPAEVDFIKAIGSPAFLAVGDNAPAFARVEMLAGLLGCLPEAEAATDAPAPRGELEALSRHLFNPGSPVEPTGAVRFAIGAGEYAERPLVADEVIRLVEEGIAPEDIFVVDDALGMSVEVQERLAEAGIASRARISCKLDKTGVGRAFRWIVGRDSPRVLSDFARSPFSGVSGRDASRLDEKWRSRRSTTVGSCLQDLIDLGGSASAIVEAVLQGDLATAAQSMAAVYLRSPADGAHAALAQAAAGKIVEFCEGCAALGVDAKDYLDLMELVGVSSRCEMGDASGGAVSFGSLRELGAKPCRAAILAGLSSDKFPISKDADQCATLLQDAGVDVRDRYIDMMRYDFYRGVSAPKDVLVVERRLADADGKESSPSALFEELVDCYRSDPSDFDDLDKATALPKSMVDGTYEEYGLLDMAGEDAVSRIAPRPSWRPLPFDARPVEVKGSGDGDAGLGREVAVLALGAPGDERTVSPTYAELYIGCPYKWFIERKVSPEGLDAELDARSLGTLTHEVLKRYYDRISAADGPRRIEEGDLAGMTNEVGRIAREFIEELSASDPASPLASLTELDRRLVKSRLRDARNLLADDRRFLPGFVPTYFERDFGDDEPVIYAGLPLHGTIDRIDVDAGGRAVVIDYKGGLGGSFDFSPGDDGALPEPEKLQVLMYATVAKRLWGLDVVGAVYRSYSRRELVRGAYDISAVGPEQLFGYEDGALSPEAFSALLEETEARVQEAYGRMASGVFAPDPLNEGVCTYCRALNCERKAS